MQVNVDAVEKAYASVKAVDQVSFKVNTGEIFAMLGPNGAGKSSTIRMLIGLTKPDGGQIVFEKDGQRLDGLSQNQFGYLPEERGLFQEKKILATLVYLGQLKGMSAAEAQQAAEQWLEMFDLTSRKNDELRTLSKGNQQKVQLISAVLHKPDIVFLDEPFSGLDPVNQEKVIEFLQRLREQGMTIVLSAHQMSLVEKLADRFLLMANGKAALYGDLESIRTQTALSNSLTLSFEHAVDGQLNALPGVIQVTQLSANEVKLEVSQATSIAAVLKQAMEVAPLTGLSTSVASLHDIYLHTVKQNQEHSHE